MLVVVDRRCAHAHGTLIRRTPGCSPSRSSSFSLCRDKMAFASGVSLCADRLDMLGTKSLQSATTLAGLAAAAALLAAQAWASFDCTEELRPGAMTDACENVTGANRRSALSPEHVAAGFVGVTGLVVLSGSGFRGLAPAGRGSIGVFRRRDNCLGCQIASFSLHGRPC